MFVMRVDADDWPAGMLLEPHDNSTGNTIDNSAADNAAAYDTATVAAAAAAAAAANDYAADTAVAPSTLSSPTPFLTPAPPHARYIAVVNPTIVEASDEHIEDKEACLSLPGYYGLVSRPAHVTVNFHTLDLAPPPSPLPSTATNTTARKAKNTRPGKKSHARSRLKGARGAGGVGGAGWNVRAVREVRLDGYGARIFQHEFDHLEGTMYTDRIVDEGKMFEMEEEDNT